MAKNKKSKKQRKEERQKAVEAKRRETGWQAPEPELEISPVADDLRALLPDWGSGKTSDEEVTAYLAEIVDSDWMVDEPEFEGVYFSPTQLTGGYVEAAAAAGFDPDSLAALDEEGRADRHVEFLCAAIDAMLTEEFQAGLVDRIESLRERLIEAGEREQAARAGLVLDFLEQADKDAIWSAVGVVLGLGQRSLDAGFDLIEAMDTTEPPFADESDEPAPEVQAVLDRYPGLLESMLTHHDQLWEEGVENLFMGTLWLDLFRGEELEPQLEKWERILDHDEAGEQEEADALVEEISQYVTGLLTPERLGQALTLLENMRDDETLEPEDAEFVTSLLSALMDEETVPEGVSALISAFFGELGLLLEERQGEAEWEEDE